jgi:heptosyltransferase-2
LDSPGKILVIRLSSLGDIVLTTPVFRALRALHPSAEIHACVKERFAPLLAPHPAVDRVLAFSEGEGVFGFARRLRREGYGLTVDLHGNLKSRIFSTAAGGAVLRSPRNLWARRTLLWFKGPSRKPVRPVAERYLQALGRGNFMGEDLRPSLVCASADRQWAARFLAKLGSSKGKLVGMAPGAAWATKRWSPARFAQTADLLARRRKDLKFVLLGDSKDREACQAVLGGLQRAGKRTLSAAGETTLGQLMGLVSSCSLLLCNDSGPMHLASGFGVPVVALFGPTVTAFGFAPTGKEDQVLQRELSCRPCSLHGSQGCPLGTHACLEEIPASEAAAAAQLALAR